MHTIGYNPKVIDHFRGLVRNHQVTIKVDDHFKSATLVGTNANSIKIVWHYEGDFTLFSTSPGGIFIKLEESLTLEQLEAWIRDWLVMVKENE